MYILTIRTDKSNAEIGIFCDDKELNYITWLAHRQLANTIHIKIKQILERQSLKINQLDGIVIFKGPGSFTGLRIGMTVAKVLAHDLKIPIIGEDTEKWQLNGIKRILNGEDEPDIMPEYGQLPHITTPRK
ncbi:MAG: hypothetical protein NVS1B10_01840 [Candidatus Saccharimonadales bacterium]